MKRLALLVPALALTAAALAGCGKEGQPLAPTAGPGPGGSGTVQDQSLVAAEAARQPEYVEDGFYESSDPIALGTATAPGGALSVQDAIEPITFWRSIRHVERRFEFAFADTDTTGRPTTAILTVNKLMTGSFNILTPDPSGGFNRTVVRKPLEDHWVRRLLFKRVPRPDGDGDDAGGLASGGTGDARHGFWRLAGITGVLVNSRDHQTQIVSLKLQGGGLDTVISDPLQFFRVRNLLKLNPLADITLTATTLQPDDVVLLLSRDHRLRLTPNGDNTYTGTFKVPWVLGCRHFGVNALSHGTLYDDQAAYDSQTWILPYMVRPMVLAEATH